MPKLSGEFRPEPGAPTRRCGPGADGCPGDSPEALPRRPRVAEERQPGFAPVCRACWRRSGCVLVQSPLREVAVPFLGAELYQQTPQAFHKTYFSKSSVL